MPSITETDRPMVNVLVKVPEDKMRLVRSRAALRGIEIRAAINEAIELWLKKEKAAA